MSGNPRVLTGWYLTPKPTSGKQFGWHIPLCNEIHWGPSVKMNSIIPTYTGSIWIYYCITGSSPETWEYHQEAIGISLTCWPGCSSTNAPGWHFTQYMFNQPLWRAYGPSTISHCNSYVTIRVPASDECCSAHGPVTRTRCAAIKLCVQLWNTWQQVVTWTDMPVQWGSMTKKCFFIA